MHRLADLLAIRPGEGRMAALVIGVMLFTAAGSALGGTGIEALFFARFGVEFLPYLYMVLGTTSFVTSLAITALLGRVRREVLYIALPLVIALVLIGARLLLTLNLSALYPALWLGKEVLNSLIGLVSWGIAGAVCDTRQAKRLFPLFGAGRILGAVVGGLGTGALVTWISTENLLAAWAVAMLIAFVLVRLLLGKRHGSGRQAVSQRRRKAPSLIAEMQQGYQFVRRSALMRWVSVAAVLFSVLYFSLALPFSKAATQAFVNEEALAGFLGLFNGLSTGAAFLASLFLANRLFARFGIMRMILAFPVIYFTGFAVLAAYAAFPILVVFRFVQMLWLMGIADPAYQAMFNAVPAARRDQVRAFIGGVPEQAGTFIAGAILVVGEQALPSQQLYLVGLIAAAATTLVIWRAARAYSGALVEALRAGQPHLLAPGAGEPFGAIQQDATAVRVVVEGLSHTDPVIRRVSAEILGGLTVREATNALVTALNDPDALVRAAALKALAHANASPALLEVLSRLGDPEPEVRVQAVEALRRLAGYPSGLTAYLRPLLHDADAGVRTRAAVGLLCLGPNPEARDLLRQMAVFGELEARVQAMNALADWGDAEAFALIAAELGDGFVPPTVRRAAARALAACGPDAAEPLVAALADEDRGVRETAAASLGHLGASALERTTSALFNPATESGALLALEHLSAQHAPSSAFIRRYASDRITAALADHAHWLAIEPFTVGDEGFRLLADALRDRAHRHGLNALRAFALLGERETYKLAIENLQSRDPNQRANALETLESVREAAPLRPLLRVWDSAPAARPSQARELTLLDVLEDADPWLRACAALAARGSTEKQLHDMLARLARSDPEALVRETAASALNPDGKMDTLQTLSIMERILFLRRVPLFADLSPADLKQVAAIASEVVFSDGERIATQGELGEEMFVIVSGEVSVTMSSDGRPENEIARRASGEVVGEMSLISQEPRMASLVAHGDVRVLCLDHKGFEGLLRERPEVSLGVMRVLCQRLKEATK